MRLAIAVIAEVALCVALPRPLALALDAADLDEVLGYTLIASTYVDGEFEGADYDDLVKLDNGMIFEFQEYEYAYAYQPPVAVFARTITPEEMRRAGANEVPAEPFTVYKLIIEDEIYDVYRVR